MFPTCPSCKQSVLDDDAVDCPFCGASMKAKPGAAKPAAPKAAAPKAPAAAPPRTSPARPAAPGRPSSAPTSPSTGGISFDLSGDFGSEAIALTRTQTKSRSLAVKCPMCETVGYAAPDAAGQSVKCANAQCLMPVFTAPRPEAEKPAAPKPVKKKSNIVGVAAVTVAIMAVGGGLVWFIAGRPHETKLTGPSDEDLELLKQTDNPNPNPNLKAPVETAKIKDPADDTPPPDPQKAEPKVSSAESIEAILKMLNDSSLQPAQNRSKPFCRRLSAEAVALTGDLARVKGQLEGLARVGRDVPYYRVTPLVEVAWQQLAKKQKKAAAKTIDEAVSSTEKLPKTGRDRLETVISLAAVLVAVNRDADAAKLLETHDSAESAGQLAQAHQTVQALGTFDLADLETRRPSLPWTSPLTIGVIYDLVGRGHSAAAQKWIAKFSDKREQAEAVAAWAEAVVWKASLNAEEIPLDPLRKAAESLPAPGNVLALSRLGLSLAIAGRKEPAESCFDKAAELAAAWEPVTDLELPADLKELSKFKAPDFAERSFSVAAAGELTHLAARLGKTEQADGFLSAALARARALAPSPQSVEQRQKEVKSEGVAALRERVKTEWKLKTENDAVVAVTGLQKTLIELLESAQQRVGLQRRLLVDAVQWGLPESVAAYIHLGSTKDATAADNLLFFDNLPGLLQEKYRATGKPDSAEAVTVAWKKMFTDQPLVRPFRILLDESLVTGESEQALERLKDFTGNDAEKDGLVLQAVCRLAKAGKYDAALKFASRLPDAVLKEECYLLIAGMAGRRGESAAAEKFLGELSQATEKVALGRGLIGGWVAAKRAAPEDDSGS